MAESHNYNDPVKERKKKSQEKVDEDEEKTR